MVIIVPRAAAQNCALMFFKAIFWIYLLIFLFSGPVLIAMGVGQLIFLDVDLLENLLLIGGGILALGFVYL